MAYYHVSSLNTQAAAVASREMIILGNSNSVLNTM